MTVSSHRPGNEGWYLLLGTILILSGCSKPSSGPPKTGNANTEAQHRQSAADYASYMAKHPAPINSSGSTSR